MSVWQRVAAVIGTRRLLRTMCLYPPYLGAGVRVVQVDTRVREVDVEMKLTPWNRNYVGTQFGGSLYSMCDPFFMLMVMENLGSEYIVWDKSAAIDFLRPGYGRVRARFELRDETLAQIRRDVDGQGKSNPRFETTILDEGGQVVARVSKVLSVKRRP